ncbi:hypothetical protein [Jannaschia donghaensis]|uniref:Uncharacterized protein n=1 Tax=Jannaschia donghaensis TaxID=420998 RepID=A0A0M6YIL7_9RHOB|nr:hypothetical protein [Jannaschia donghaensis]CTQ49515.1 hypothetical protein JDO7802_01529 [Jannaschia donghaensis]
MTILEATILAASFGILMAIVRFAVLAWAPRSFAARLLRKTIV